MDAIRHNRIITGIIIAVTISACTTTQQTPIEQQQPITYTYADQYTPVANALNELNTYLQTVTTTTTTTSVPKYRNTQQPDGNMWDVLAQCETGGDWSANTGNGYGGGLQFAHTERWSTWRAFGGEQYAPHPWEATREQQIDVGERVLESSGFKAWPGCSRKHGWL